MAAQEIKKKRSAFKIALKMSVIVAASFFISIYIAEKMGVKNPNISSQDYVRAMWNNDVPATPTVTGAYLSSRAAQHRNDWAQAAEFLSQALSLAEDKVRAAEKGADDGAQLSALVPPFLTDVSSQSNADEVEANTLENDNEVAPSKINELRQRILIFNLGAGKFDDALEQARVLEQSVMSDEERENALGIEQAVLMIEAFRKNDMLAVENHMPKFSQGLVAQSLRPIFETWSRVAKFEADKLDNPDNQEDVKRPDFRLGALLPLHAIYALEFTGDIEAARQAYQRLNNRMDNTASKLAFSSFLARNEEVDEAAKIADQLAQEFPNDEEIKAFREAIESQDARENNETFQTLSAHLRSINHAMAVSFYDVAINHLANGNEETALLLGEMAYALVQDLPRVNFMLSDILIERRNYDQALKILENIKEDHPVYNEAVISRGEIFAEQGRQSEAIALFEKTMGNNKFDPDIATHLANLYRTETQYDKSLEVYRQIIAYYDGIVPDHLWSIYYYKGVVHHEMDQWPLAEEQLLKAKELRPDNPYVLNFLGYSWVDQNMNVEEALEILRRAYELQPDSGFIADSVGWAYYKLGDYEKATEYLEEAVELMPYDPEVVDHLGDVYWQTGRKLEAYYQWQRVLDYADPEDKNHGKITESAKKKMEIGL